MQKLIGTLALDGFQWTGQRLTRIEENTFDVAEQAGLLENLYASLGFEHGQQIRHELKLADDQYMAGKW